MAYLASQPPFVGRQRELSLLQEQLRAAATGRGGLALIAGEAGIGKTTIAESLAADAASRGVLVLTGYATDLAETPPYGPWAELLAAAPQRSDLPAPPDLVGVAVAASQADLFARVRAYLTALAAHQPLLLLLEDMHWADAASLDLLRVLARSLGALPVLLLATYRPEDLARDHPFYTLLPAVVREARPLRLDLRPLSAEEMRDLVAVRYPLPVHDTVRLSSWLQSRAEGNPFYAGELLRGLEEEGLLQPSPSGWVLGDLARASLPTLLRQVIDVRVARLGAEARQALAVAAVIGQEASLTLWATVSGAAEESLLSVIAAAEAAHVLAITADGSAVRFAHALVREAVHAETPATQRRAWHRRAAEALAALPGAEPDAVAYHFREGGDPRALEWLLRAAARAERADAWHIAADRCLAALALLERQGAAAAERGWLAYRIAALGRYRDPRGSLGTLEAAARLAADAEDRVLAACVLFLRGNLHCYVGEFGPGLATLAAGATALDALDDDERARLRAQGVIGGFVPHGGQQRATLVMRLAGTGRFAEALQLGEEIIRPRPVSGATDRLEDVAVANASRGVAVARAALGQADEARRGFAAARTAFQRLDDLFHVGVTATQELQWVGLTYLADRPAEWERLAAEAEHAWRQAGDTPADLPHGFARLPVLLHGGDWATARELAEAVQAGGGSYAATAVRALAVLALEQGDSGLLRRIVRAEVPAGPGTPVGTANFSTVLLLQRLAASQALRMGDLTEACEWLGAHDRWLAWSGAVLGRAEGQLGWAAYYRAAGDLALSRRHAETALADANSPRQPLCMLASHRLLGELVTAAHRNSAAAAELEQALALAAACIAPYERALTLLSLADLRLSAGEAAAARSLLDEACGIFTRLGAHPALERAAALAARLSPSVRTTRRYPAGLSEREVEVLRCLAAGQSNREIAATLTLSVRTVEKHIAHVYAKIGARGRADAAAYTVRHGLLTETTTLS